MWSKAASANGSTRVFHQCFALARLLTETLRPEEQNRIKIFVLDVSAHHHPDPR